MVDKSYSRNSKLTRRDFIKSTTAAGIASLTFGANRIYAAGSDKIRIGLIGCGGIYLKIILITADNSSPRT